MKFFATRCRRIPHTGNSAGFSIIELVVVMAIMIVVIMISAGAFERIAKMATVQTSSSDSNIQGIVGLEIMRSDLEHAGFGLPWTSPSSDTFIADFEESLVNANFLAKGIDPKVFNDKNNASSDLKKTPRAIQSATATGAGSWENGRDYIVIKSTFVAMNTTAKHWSFLEGLGASSSIKQWGNVTDDIATDDRVITLKTMTVDKKPYRELVGTSITNFSYKVPAISAGKYTPPTGFQADTSDLFLVYGVSDTADLKFPYNRVDYYIKRPSAAKDTSARCAPGTGILYKANLNHSTSAGVTQYPLLDCVVDMQVIYSLDSNNDGGVDLHGDENILTNMTAEDIRTQLKEIRVYILTHEGGKDSSFNYPTSTIRVGGFGLGRDYDLAALDGIGTSWKNYRWKLYTLVVAPKNINN